MPYIYVDIILHLCIHMVSYLKVVKKMVKVYYNRA
jgi:hypothetical protein